MLREALADVRNGPSGARPAVRGRAGAELREAARLGADEVLRAQESSAAGLTAEAAEDRRASYGDNQVAHERPPAWYVHLWHGFANAFSALLAVLFTWAALSVAYYLPYPVGFFITTFASGSYVVARFLSYLIGRRAAGRVFPRPAAWPLCFGS